MYIPFIMINENDYPHLLSILITKQPMSDDDDSKEEYYVLGPFDNTKLKEVQDIVELLEKYIKIKAKVEIVNIRYLINLGDVNSYGCMPLMNDSTYIITRDDGEDHVEQAIDAHLLSRYYDWDSMAEAELIGSAVEEALLDIHNYINNQP